MQDGSDEAECPKDYSFEDCKTIEECLWHSAIPGRSNVFYIKYKSTLILCVVTFHN